MKTSKAGRDLIEKFEGNILTAYRCPAGKWTVGRGHTGADVLPGMKITQAESDALFDLDLSVAERAVKANVRVGLHQNQFDALVSFVFNLGGAAFAGSTLLKLLNLHQIRAAGDQFERWIHSGGAVLPGLVRRRKAEKAMFLNGSVEV